jgi:DNA-binding PadR family transcriptional regulator
MIGTTSEAPAARLPEALPSRDPERDLVRLVVLRELEDSGPLTGMETLNAVASLACYLDVTRPVYALLHELRDAGLLTASAGRPPRYAITELGRREAERLAWRCWPRLRDVLVSLNVCIGCLSPRDPWPSARPRPGDRMIPGLTLAGVRAARSGSDRRPPGCGSSAEPSPAVG